MRVQHAVSSAGDRDDFRARYKLGERSCDDARQRRAGSAIGDKNCSIECVKLLLRDYLRKSCSHVLSILRSSTDEKSLNREWQLVEGAWAEPELDHVAYRLGLAAQNSGDIRTEETTCLIEGLWLVHQFERPHEHRFDQ